MKLNRLTIATLILFVLSLLVFSPADRSWSEEKQKEKEAIKMVEPGKVVDDSGEVIREKAPQVNRHQPFSRFGFNNDPFLTDDPFQMIEQMQQEMDQMFDQRFPTFNQLRNNHSSFRTPFNHSSNMRINMKEENGNLKVICEMPGMDKKALKIRVHENRLYISGERKNQLEEKSDNFYRKEISHGSVSRVLPLPFKVDEKKAKAEYKDGVLTITIPKIGELKKEEPGTLIPIQ